MEETKPTIRYRANFSVTTKGVFTPDVTVEVSGVDVNSVFEVTKLQIRDQLSQLFDTVSEVAQSKGFVSSVVEQK